MSAYLAIWQDAAGKLVVLGAICSLDDCPQTVTFLGAGGCELLQAWLPRAKWLCNTTNLVAGDADVRYHRHQCLHLPRHQRLCWKGLEHC